MIQFEPILSGYWLIAVLGAIFFIAVFQVISVFYKKVARSYLKVFLFLIFCSLVTLYILNPTWERELPKRSALLISANQNKADFTDFSKELQVDKILQEGESAEGFSKIHIFGEDYEKETLLSLPMVNLEWTPSSVEGQILEDLNWEGILSYGQRQKMKGKLRSEAEGKLQVKFAGEVWADMSFEGRDFELGFPALILGKNEMDLYLDEIKLGTIRYFVTAPRQKSFELKVGFPNPESRFLSEYLMKRGEQVSLSTQVSVGSSIVIGEESGEKGILIIDPSQIKNTNFSELGTDYEALLLVNVENPERDILEFNRRFGSEFAINKVAAQYLEREDGTTAHPYNFQVKNNQDTLGYSVAAFERMGDYTLGVSLLGDTFSLVLSGDSLAYAKAWEPVIEKLANKTKHSFRLKSPIFKGIKSKLIHSNVSEVPQNIENERIILSWENDPLEGESYFSNFLPLESGWIDLSESLTIYVEEPEDFSSINDRMVLWEFLKERREAYRQGEDKLLSKNEVPAWLWFILILVAASLVWIEPRYRS